MKQALMAGLLATLALSAQASGFLPVDEAVQPLKQRLALIDGEMPRLLALAQARPAPNEGRQALHERALAWTRLQDLRDEQARLKAELAEALQAAKNPLRLH